MAAQSINNPPVQPEGGYLPVNLSVRVPGLHVIPTEVRGHSKAAWIVSTKMGILLRCLGIVVWSFLAAVITLASLYLMHTLIMNKEDPPELARGSHLVDFIRVNQAPQLQTRIRKPAPPPMPGEPPEISPSTTLNITQVSDQGWSWQPPAAVESDFGGISMPGTNLENGEYLPIIKIQPVYPRRALARKMVGWVLVEFTVTEKGSVLEPVVLENCAMTQQKNMPGDCEGAPNPIFDEAALNAAKKFKYKPRVIDGTPIATTGVLNLIHFKAFQDAAENPT